MVMWQLRSVLLASLCWSTAIASAIERPQEPLLDASLASGKTGHWHDLFAFHKNLTEIESITYNEQGAGEWLAHSLKSQGYTVETQWVDKDEGRFNVYAYPGDVRETRVLVSSHYDTVCYSTRRLACRPALIWTIGPSILSLQAREWDHPRPWVSR